MDDYQDGIVAEDMPKNWDELMAHFRKVQVQMSDLEKENRNLKEQINYYMGQAHAYEHALRLNAEEINGRNKD